jgi:hypothetical protein
MEPFFKSVPGSVAAVEPLGVCVFDMVDVNLL